MFNIPEAKSIMDKCKKFREKEADVYSKFIEAADAHNMSVRVGDTVLYVEDNPESVSMFKTLLEFACNSHTCEKMQVVPTAHIADAKEFIEENYLALKCVVLDLQLEMEDGEALLDWIVARYGKALPAIVYTSDTTRVTSIHEKYDFVEILVKGSTSNNELVAAVRRRRSCAIDGTDCNLPSCGKCKQPKE
jgi:CheY-like chemotaxis protein